MNLSKWVLIVEDDEDFAQRVSMWLWIYWADVSVVNNLELANEVLEEMLLIHNRIVILLDWYFPDTQETFDKWKQFSRDLEKNYDNNDIKFIDNVFLLMENIKERQILILANSKEVGSSTYIIRHWWKKIEETNMWDQIVFEPTDKHIWRVELYIERFLK